MTFCLSCGKAYEGSPSFCPNCGSSLSSAVAPMQAPVPKTTPRLNNNFRVLAGLGTLVIFISLFLPWLTITFLGQFNLSLADIYIDISQSSSQLSSSGLNLPSSTPQLGQYFASAAGIIGAIVLYPITLIVGLTSIASRRATLPAGILGVLTGLAWILGVESLKSTIAQQASQLGGLFGSAIAGAAMSLVTVGYGAYAVMLGGVLTAIGYFMSKPK